MIHVVPYSDLWPREFERVAAVLRAALVGTPGARVEHVGSTSVPGLAAKPIIDIDVVVAAHQMLPAIHALERLGYAHDGDLGLDGREAFDAPDDDPPRHVYVCLEGTLHVRNHLAVRDILRRRPDLRDSYAAVKLALTDDPDMDIDTYTAGKSAVLQEVLAESDLTAPERRLIRELNDPMGEYAR
jgi:GrpB-like predicted nucleotidyltransferase (UPF0157 family)